MPKICPRYKKCPKEFSARCGRFCSAEPAGYDSCRPLVKGEELIYAY